MGKRMRDKTLYQKKVINKLGEFNDPKTESTFRNDFFQTYKKFSSLIIGIIGAMILLFVVFDFYITNNKEFLPITLTIRILAFLVCMFSSFMIVKTKNANLIQLLIVIAHSVVVIAFQSILFINSNHSLQSQFLIFILIIFAISLTPSRWIITLIFVPLVVAIFSALVPTYIPVATLDVGAWIECIVYLVISGTIGIFFCYSLQILWRKQFISKLELQESSITDSLTQIYNRYKFDSLLNFQVKNSLLTGNTFSLIMYDIDNFKTFNDKYGHMVGDKILISLARIVSDNIRKTDYFARWGGEEFVVLLPDTEINAAHIIAEKLRVLIATNDVSMDLRLTVSLGVAGFTPNDDVDSIIRKVDSALYQAKKEGKNKVIVANN